MKDIDVSEVLYPYAAAVAGLNEKTTMKEHLAVANILCKGNEAVLGHKY